VRFPSLLLQPTKYSITVTTVQSRYNETKTHICLADMSINPNPTFKYVVWIEWQLLGSLALIN